MHKITLVGFALPSAQPRTVEPLDRAYHELAAGRPEDALARLNAIPASKRTTQTMLARAVALDELGRWQEAMGLMQRVLARHDEFEPIVGVVMRNHLDRFEQPLRAGPGRSLFHALLEVLPDHSDRAPR